MPSFKENPLTEYINSVLYRMFFCRGASGHHHCSTATNDIRSAVLMPAQSHSKKKKSLYKVPYCVQLLYGIAQSAQ
jgi:hypothetical protein